MKTHILVTTAVLAAVGVSGVAIYNYQHKVANEKPGLSISQLQGQVTNLERTLSLHDAVNKVNLQNANDQFKTDQANLCQFISQHVNTKLVTVPSECTANPN